MSDMEICFTCVGRKAGDSDDPCIHGEAGLVRSEDADAQVGKYRAPALEKGLDILELLARSPAPLSMAEISDGVGRSKGEIFRMLQVLEDRGYIARGSGENGYALTHRLFMLGMEQPPVKGMMEAALPVMHRLTDQIQQPCHLSVTSREEIVVVARVDAPGEIGLAVVRVGHRRPMAHSTSGVVLFAFQGEAIRARWLALLGEAEPGLDAAAFQLRAGWPGPGRRLFAGCQRRGRRRGRPVGAGAAARPRGLRADRAVPGGTHGAGARRGRRRAAARGRGGDLRHPDVRRRHGALRAARPRKTPRGVDRAATSL